MVDVQVTTIAGTEGVVEDGAIEKLRAGMRGQLLMASDEGYQDARPLWNGIRRIGPSHA